MERARFVDFLERVVVGRKISKHGDVFRKASPIARVHKDAPPFLVLHGERDTLVPVNNRWNVSEALDAARYYADVTGRRVSIEYALIRDINDQPWRADLLGKRLHGALGPLVHVNLIPLNPTPGSKWDASPKAAEREFVKRVRERGVSCTVRDTRGREIAAACGQLAAQA